MKLELKHIAPYLPYKLKMEILNYKSDYVGLKYSEINGYYYVGEAPHFTYNGGSTGKSFLEFKPILRPLSDFNKKLYKEVKALYPNTDSFDVCYNIGLSKYPSVALNSITEYCIILFFIENHFDVFGLIPKGLAIDINTLP